MSIILSTLDADLACDVTRRLKATLPDAGAVFVSLAGGHIDIDVRDDYAESAKAILAGMVEKKVMEVDVLGRMLDAVQGEPTIERREAECMAALHSDEAMDSDAQ